MTVVVLVVLQEMILMLGVVQEYDQYSLAEWNCHLCIFQNTPHHACLGVADVVEHVAALGVGETEAGLGGSSSGLEWETVLQHSCILGKIPHW